MTGYDEWKTTDPADETLGSIDLVEGCIECGDGLEPIFRAGVEIWRPSVGLCHACHQAEAHEQERCSCWSEEAEEECLHGPRIIPATPQTWRNRP
jgi:hypothetical protein